MKMKNKVDANLVRGIGLAASTKAAESRIGQFMVPRTDINVYDNWRAPEATTDADEDFKALVAAIRRDGLITAPTVMRDAAGKLWLLEGHRRLAALDKIQGKPEYSLPVTVSPGTWTEQLHYQRLGAGEFQLEATPYERCRFFFANDLRRASKIEMSAVAKSWGIGAKQLEKMQRAWNAAQRDERLMAAFARKKAPVSLDKLAPLHSATTAEIDAFIAGGMAEPAKRGRPGGGAPNPGANGAGKTPNPRSAGLAMLIGAKHPIFYYQSWLMTGKVAGAEVSAEEFATMLADYDYGAIDEDVSDDE